MAKARQKKSKANLRDRVLQERIQPGLGRLGYVAKKSIDLDVTIPDTDLEEPVLAVARLNGAPRIVCDLLPTIPSDSSFDTEAYIRAQVIYEIRNCYSGKTPSHAWITDGEVDFFFDYQKQEQVSFLPKAAEAIRELDRAKQEELVQKSRLARQQEAFYEALRQLREEFHSTGRIDDANAKLDEIAKLLVMKVHEEKRRLNNEEYRFSVDYLSKTAKLKWKDESKIAEALRWLFEDIISDSYYKNADGTSIFGSNGSLNIQPTDDAFARKVVELLNKTEILHFGTDEDGKQRELHFDVLNETFGHFVRDNFRNNKEDAQYMTPPEAVNAMVDLAFCDIENDPVDRERILGASQKNPYLIVDPTCGTGTFLVAALRRANRFLDEHVSEVRRRNHLKRIFKDHCVRGQDKVDRMVRLSKMNMIMFGDGSSNITQGNSILPELTPGEQLESLIGKVDLIVTNPPFGAEFLVGDLVPDLENPRYPLIYDYFLRDVHEALLAIEAELESHESNPPKTTASVTEKRKWEKRQQRLRKAIERAHKKIETAKGKKANSEIILIDRCLQVLRPGGRLVMVVPDSILTNTRFEEFTRSWLKRRAILKAVVSFPTVTFSQAGTLTKTSALYIQKQTLGNTLTQDKVFMAVCNDIGYEVKTVGGFPKRIKKGSNELLRIIDGYRETRREAK
ncbi:MAG TPA: SAM-dependent DNA methyltransferase [Desulfobacterales bacterium]|nr:SAM-dependent DNA methyltransferase [Desulfobacterales bacterium]